ncbi:MAG: MBL fold metallo-hydrolase [Gemmatimonadaceae bacterium]
MRLTFLGTGTSFGVPQIGCGCHVCRSSDPRDRRTRTGALVRSNGGSQVLLDTPPELRLQLLANKVERVDAVLFTHDHADHTHGIDDLRAISVRRGELPVYGSAQTLASLARKFAYIFDDTMRPLPGTSKPEVHAYTMLDGHAVTVAGLEVTPVAVPHGPVTVFAFKIGRLAYVTDAKSLPVEAVDQLRGSSVLVLNALFRTEHPTHLSIPEALHAAESVGAERTYLTHLTHDNFHADLEREMPSGVWPAYDGLTIDID